MNSRRVVITGLGAIAPNGVGKEAFWKALMEGRSGIGRITRFDPSNYSSQVAGEVNDFDPTQFFDKKEYRRMGRATQFAVAATKMALSDARLEEIRNSNWRKGVIVGHESMVMEIVEEQHNRFRERDDPTRILPSTIPMITPNAPAAAVAQWLGTEDFLATLATNCVASLHAIGYATEQIQENRLDFAIAGGTSSTLTPYSFGCFCALDILTSNRDPARASRPFDRERDGVVYAEGAGMLILEPLEAARARGASIYGEVLGYVEGNRTHLREGQGLAETIRLGLKQAHLRPKDIDYICAHGSSHPERDLQETLAIKQVFGDHAYRMPISSIKSMIGHPGGAAGPLQLIASVMAIQESWIPPTINYEHPDPQCNLDYVPNQSRRNQICAALIISRGHGGVESCLVVRGI